MNKTAVGLGAFVCGLGIGAVGMYVSMNKRFEEEMHNEVENLKEYYEHKVAEYIKNLPENVTVQAVINTVEENDPVEEVNQIDYGKFSQGKKIEKEPEIEVKKEVEEVEKDPCIIPKELFASEPGYELVTLYHFSDGVLADCYKEIVDLGVDYAKHFGNDPDDPDCVYVKNDRLKVYYEILKDLRTFDEVLNEGPGKIE